MVTVSITVNVDNMTPDRSGDPLSLSNLSNYPSGNVKGEKSQSIQNHHAESIAGSQHMTDTPPAAHPADVPLSQTIHDLSPQCYLKVPMNQRSTKILMRPISIRVAAWVPNEAQLLHKPHM